MRSPAEDPGGGGRSGGGRTRALPPASLLFLCLFAGQAALIALTPVLAEVARDFDVSTATAGQLRSASGLVAGITAIAMGRFGARVGLRDLLLGGLALLATGSLLSALAPAFWILVAAQLVLGAGLAIVLSGGLAAAAEWAEPGRRAHLLSWALVGQPAAWIVGMPVIGALGDVNWRLGFIAIPLAAAAVALAGISSRPADPPSDSGDGGWGLLAEERAVAAWAAGELLAFGAWAGTLVYAGALLVETYGASSGTAGLLLGVAAVAYVPGNFLARGHVASSARLLLVFVPVASAALVAAFGGHRPSLAVSGALLAALAFAAGARTIAGSEMGLQVCERRRLFAMRVRAAANQFGYLLGSAVGGLALAAGGYTALGWAFAALFALAAVPHAHAWARGERRRGGASRPAEGAT